MALILVVEDDENNFELLKWDLEDLQHEFLHATNAEDAVRLARENDFDLVLMDITIPPHANEPHNNQPHGLKASTDIRALGQEMAIIAITAHGMEHMKKAVIVAGCNEILEKPFDFNQLSECLSKWLAHYNRF